MHVISEEGVAHDHIARLQLRMHLGGQRQLAGSQPRIHQTLDEPTPPMHEGQAIGDGKATALSLIRRTAIMLAQGRRVGKREPRAIEQKGAMPQPTIGVG